MKPFARPALAVLAMSATLAPGAVAAPADPPPATPPAAKATPSAAPAVAPAPAPAASESPAAAPAPTPATSTAAAPTPASATAASPSAIAPAPSGGAATTLGDSGSTTANTPPPKREAPSSLEVALSIGPTVTLGEAANPEYTPSVSRFGAFGDFAIGYRSSYFIDPFVSLGYGTLASGEVHLPNGVWGAGGTLEQHLSVVTLSPGLTADIWRIRPRFGIGLAFVTESYKFAGQTHSSTQTPLLAELGLGFVAYDSPRFRLDVEARAVVIQGADVRFGTLDVVLRADAVYFGGGH
jgi:hypothetical protein